jgi:hypothetical protein
MALADYLFGGPDIDVDPEKANRIMAQRRHLAYEAQLRSPATTAKQLVPIDELFHDAIHGLDIVLMKYLKVTPEYPVSDLFCNIPFRTYTVAQRRGENFELTMGTLGDRHTGESITEGTLEWRAIAEGKPQIVVSDNFTSANGCTVIYPIIGKTGLVKGILDISGDDFQPEHLMRVKAAAIATRPYLKHDKCRYSMVRSVLEMIGTLYAMETDTNKNYLGKLSTLFSAWMLEGKPKDAAQYIERNLVISNESSSHYTEFKDTFYRISRELNSRAREFGITGKKQFELRELVLKIDHLQEAEEREAEGARRLQQIIKERYAIGGFGDKSQDSSWVLAMSENLVGNKRWHKTI